MAYIVPSLLLESSRTILVVCAICRMPRGAELERCPKCNVAYLHRVYTLGDAMARCCTNGSEPVRPWLAI